MLPTNLVIYFTTAAVCMCWLGRPRVSAHGGMSVPYDTYIRLWSLYLCPTYKLPSSLYAKETTSDLSVLEKGSLMFLTYFSIFSHHKYGLLAADLGLDL